ncbi:hypothetical protein ML462_14050 [Gramella lutea]|uniref:Uncharacterized protein n=1 Tax=Christiangramia lutea TaxID=1607951 RepID=A0A9X1V763_9FLAO|nr:hypothetical protein [Christiangramia lutea]MCH4824294.1 hypothetical protein [Christiangramia lutea]
MKTLSRNELVQKSVAIFKGRTEAVLFATSDGQFFIFKDRANMHAKSQKTPLKVYEIERSEVEDQLPKEKETKAAASTKSKPKTVEQIKADVEDTEDLEKLAAMLKEEQEGKDRTTAVEAIQNRIAELEPKED